MNSRFCRSCFVLFACAVTLVGCGSGHGQQAAVVQYGIKTLNVPPEAPTSYTFRVSDAGDTTGYVYCVGPVIWDSEGNMTRLADPPGWQIANTDCMDTICINQSGTMAGTAIILQGESRIRAVIQWDSVSQAKVLCTTGDPDVGNLQVCGLSDTGRIFVLKMSRSTGKNSIQIFEPDGTTTDGTPPGDLGTVSITYGNNFGILVGQMLINGSWQAIKIDTTRKTLQVLPMLPGADTPSGSTNAVSVNNQGVIVGSCCSGTQSTWVIWDGLGKIHDLGLPPGFDSGTACGINDSGLIVGGAAKTGGDSAFVRMPDGRWINLGLFDGIAASHPYTVNNMGQVSGITYPTNPVGGRMTRAVVWSPLGR